MTKNTMANKLPRKLTQKMQIVGEQIRLARLRRNLSMAQVAERATCSEVTLCKVRRDCLRSPSESTCVCSMRFSWMTTYCCWQRMTISEGYCRTWD